NTIGVIGVAPNVGIYAAKGLNSQGSGYSSDLTLCIQDCVAHGVKVISMSWGSSGNSTLIQAALQDAAAGQVKNPDNTITQYVPAGIVLVAASGNEGNFQPIGYPAAHSFVLAIGATGSGESDTDNPL